MIAWTVVEPETSLGFPFSSALLYNFHAPFHLSLLPFLSGSSGHCYYQTIVTPVSLPDSPCSRIPHTVTLVSIPASAEGNNGCKGRGFSVAIDQPLSPTNGYSPEHGRTVRVSQWVYHSMIVSMCVRVCIFYGHCVKRETTLTLPCVGGQRMEKGRVKMEDSVIDDIHLKCIIEWKEMSRSPCYSNETRLYQISGLCPDGTFQCVQKGIWGVLFNFFPLIVLLHSGWTQTASVQMWKTPFMLEIRFWRSTGRPFTTFLWMRYSPHWPSHIVNILLYCKYANENHGVLNCPVVEEGKVLILALS